jgi:polysaccharide deacetylase family protein (PEP-CTERM system associated)
VLHFLSFDVEDVYQSFKERNIDGWSSDIVGEKRRIKEILELLDKTQTKATFFILTEILNNYKEEILEIKSKGHEIASHGHNHIRIWKRTPKEFQYDIQKSKYLLESLIQSEVKGYRAPGFSLDNRSPWAPELISNVGFKYSSSSCYSVNALPKDLRYFSDRTKRVGLLEFPATTLNSFYPKIRLCGGFYFRLFPYWLNRRIIDSYNEKNKAVNLYLHPYEMSENSFKAQAPVYIKFVRYYNLHRTGDKLGRLLEEFSFQRMDVTI